MAKTKRKIVTPYSKGEEIFHSVSHGVGSLLAVVGTTIMLTVSVISGRVLSIVAAAIYGFSLIVMYTMSTLYHALPYPKAKHVFKILDHASIYLLIAGTYTPITLITLRGTASGLVILAVVWAAAIVGITLGACNVKHYKKAELALYILMGWAIVWDFSSVVAALGQGGLILLIVGGLSYTGGVIFYRMKSIPFMHGVWHLFVVLGSVLHYLCILLFVL